ncbi:MAG TPA: four helix bundle protein [Bacteroidales bacterium]
MAQYEHLPVFKKSYDLLLAIYQSVSMFGKEFKYTIGEKLKNEALELIVCIYKVNSRVNKLSMITEAKEHLGVTRLYIRITKDLKQITLKKMIFFGYYFNHYNIL